MDYRDRSMRHACLVFLLVSGCSVDLASLQGAGARSAPDAGAMVSIDAASIPMGSCPSYAELESRNDFAIHDLGLELAHSVVEGDVGPPELTDSGLRARMHIDAVWQGLFFLEGSDVWVHFADGDVGSLALPGRLVVGFDGNRLPTYDDRREATWWSTLVAFPAGKWSSPLASTFRSALASHVAVVRIAEQDEDRTRLAVVDVLKGELPDSVLVNWSRRTFAVEFPAPGDGTFIASFDHVEYSDTVRAHLGALRDLRPATEAMLSTARTEIARPYPTIHASYIARNARDYRTRWSFKLAEHVVATSVDGLAGECCTGAGGTYVQHAITEYLQGASDRSACIVGGHAYYSDERCGDRFVLAIDQLDATQATNPGPLTCEPFTSAWESGVPTVAVRGRVAADRRDEVVTWLRSPHPIYRLGETPVVEPLPGPDALWSKDLGLQPALAAATHLARLKIVEVTERGGGHEVTFETTFSPRVYDHLPVHRVSMAFECGDPRWFRVGAEYLAPIILSESAPWQRPDFELERGFVVPGVLLPPRDYVIRTAEKFMARIGGVPN